MTGVVNKDKVRRSFASAAHTYDQAAQLQCEVGSTLLDLFVPVPLAGTVMDLGCGTGFLSTELLKQKKLSACDLLAVDIALPMLEASKRKLAHHSLLGYVCADAEHLPFANNSVQHIFSNLALQWCRQLDKACLEFGRVLSPGGQIVFSTFGTRTLHELKSAWQAVDTDQHVNDFYSAKQIDAILRHAGMTNIVVQSTVHCRYYPSVPALLRELKDLGAQTVSTRRSTLTGKAHWRAMLSAYGAEQNGLYPASFEVITVQAKV